MITYFLKKSIYDLNCHIPQKERQFQYCKLHLFVQLIRLSHGKLYTVPSMAMEIMHLPSSNMTAVRQSPIQLLMPLSLLNFSSLTPTLDTLHYALKPK